MKYYQYLAVTREIEIQDGDLQRRNTYHLASMQNNFKIPTTSDLSVDRNSFIKMYQFLEFK